MIYCVKAKLEAIPSSHPLSTRNREETELSMMAEANSCYVPQTKVDWTSASAYLQFRRWRKEAERILNGPLAARSDKVKVNHIYIWAGAHAESLIEARVAEDPAQEPGTPDQLLDQLAACLTHATFFREAREDFYSIYQKTDENTTTYFSRIIELYHQAEFPAGTDFLIVDKLIHGCVHEKCKRELMSKGKNVAVKDCLDIMRRYEAVDVTIKKMSSASDNTVQVNASSYATFSQHPKLKTINSDKSKYAASKQHKPRQVNSGNPCPWCKGDTHPRDQCPAKEAQCGYCKKYGHFERACFRKKNQLKQYKHVKKQHVVDLAPDADSEYGDDSECDLSAVFLQAVSKQKPQELLAPVTFLNGTRSPWTVKGKVDTGAMVSCIPLSLLRNIGLSKRNVKPSKAVIKGISGTQLKNCGTLEVEVSCNNIHDNMKFYVIEQECTFILGLEFCKKFKLVTIAPVCIQQSVTIEHVTAVHIAEESEFNYETLRKKVASTLASWKKNW